MYWLVHIFWVCSLAVSQVTLTGNAAALLVVVPA